MQEGKSAALGIVLSEMPSEPDVQRFRSLEEGLWRDDADARNDVLSTEFQEFCRFGAVYDRDHLIDAQTSEIEVEFPFENFEAEALTDDVVLVTYENTVVSNGSRQRARRSSIWVRSDGDWKLRFQQATTLPEA